MEGKIFCFTFLFLYSLATSNAQTVERVPFRIYNTDTAELMKRIEKVEKIALHSPDSALQICSEVLKLCKSIKFNRGIIATYVKIAYIFSLKEEYLKTFKYYKSTLPYCRGENEYLKALIYNSIGITHICLAQNEIASEVFLKAAGYAQKFEDSDVFPLERIYLNLATSLSNLRQYHKALHYIDLAYNISAKNKNYEQQASALVRKANIYYELNNTSHERPLYDSAISFARKHNLKYTLFAALANSGNSYLKTREIKKAFEHLFEAYNFDSIFTPFKKADISLLLGKAYILKQDYDSALYWLNRTNEQSHALPYKRAEVLKYYAELYEAKGDNTRAVHYFKSFMHLKDSIDNNERSARAVELETQYRTAEKDKEIAEQQLQITRQQASLKQSRINTTAGIIISLLLIILLVITRRSIKHKQKRLQQEAETQILKATLDSEQKERNRIAMELHDGIVSDLTAIKLNLEITHPLPDQLQPYTASVRQLGTAIRDIRNTAHNLMPEILLRHHLEDAIRMLCSNVERTGRLSIRFLSYGDFTQIKMQERQSIYRMIQELLHNIIKHAQADQALVQISCYENLFTATIEDNGIGINHKNKNQTDGIGTRNIEERITRMNGHISCGASSFGKGLSVYIELEINNEQLTMDS